LFNKLLQTTFGRRLVFVGNATLFAPDSGSEANAISQYESIIERKGVAHKVK